MAKEDSAYINGCLTSGMSPTLSERDHDLGQKSPVESSRRQSSVTFESSIEDTSHCSMPPSDMRNSQSDGEDMPNETGASATSRRTGQLPLSFQSHENTKSLSRTSENALSHPQQ